MTLIVTLTSEEEARVRRSAAALGLQAEEYARRLLTASATDRIPVPRTPSIIEAVDTALVQAGLMLEAPPGIDPDEFRRYRPVHATGAPLSQSIIQDRR